MAISKKTKIFEVDGKRYRFNRLNFQSKFNDYSSKHSLGKEELEIKLANALYVSQSAIHNWRCRSNGPSTIRIIEKIAEVFEMDYLNLLEEVKTMNDNYTNDNNNCIYTKLHLESIKRIYDEIICFLDEFTNTGGFTTSLWYEYLDKGIKNPEDAIYDYVESKIQRIFLTLNKEFFYLHNLLIYKELCDYCYNDLFEIYDGKLGYAYRFEAYSEGNPTTEEDYNKALMRINDIISSCVKN